MQSGTEVFDKGWWFGHARRYGQYLIAAVGHQNGVFPLGRQTAIPGHHRPLIGQCAQFAPTGINHGLNSENHARLKFHASAWASIVQNLRVLVKGLANAVTAVLTHDRVIMTFGVLLNDMANITQMCPWADLLYAQPHAFISDLGQAASEDRRLANKVHPTRITIPAILDHSDVQIDDIAVPEFLVSRATRNSVTAISSIWTSQRSRMAGMVTRVGCTLLASLLSSLAA